MASTLTVDKIKGGSSGVALTLPTGAGTSGYLLKTDGVGTLSWAADAGGIASLAADTTPQLGGFLDANGNYMQTEKGADIVSASPLVITTVGDYFDVTGTVSFAVMTVAADRQFTLQFDGILTMTHHATNLDLPGEANITTAAGDVATFQSTGANTVQCINYTKANGEAVVSAGGGKVLQVVQTHLITTSSTTVPESLNTYVNITDLNASITPLTGSKVRITIRWNGAVSAQLHGQIFGIRRGSAGTVLGNPASAIGRPIGMCNLTTNYTNTYTQHSQSAFYSFVDDSPGGDGSTSISYYCISTNGGGGGTVYTNRTVSDSNTNDHERLTSTIILEEIGA